MNPLLSRQLRKHLSPEQVEDPSMQAFFKAVSNAYGELESDLRFVEHTLEVTSQELNEANEKLRLESENKIRELSQYYLETLECQDGMILRVVRKGEAYVHTLCRGGLAKRLGLLPEKVEDREPSQFLPIERARALCQIYDRAWAGEECVYEDSSDNDEIHYLAHFRPMKVGGRVVELIVSAVEVTNLKRTQRELTAAKEQAESADRAKSEFLAVMSHEIRTPLNAVLGFTSLLQSSKLTPEQRNWVDTTSQSGRSLLTLLNDILDFSKIEAGQLTFSHAPFDLPDLLDSIRSLFAARAEEKGIAFEVFVEPGVPQVMISDSARLRQILVNLASNAVKFTQVGGVTLRVGVRPVSGRPSTHRELLQVAVRDTGVGIPAHLQDRLFKPFSQADSSTTRQYGGTGLGLAISQRLAKALGGSITFTSEAGQGSEFVLSVALNKMQDLNTLSKTTAAIGGPTSVASRPVNVSARPTFKARVLVAEDHQHNRQLIERILGSYGLKPEMVEDGAQAVEAVQRSEFDLIFMDVRMPKMDGMDATKEIRRLLTGKPQPHIVAVTANAFDEEQRQCLDAGMDAVLLKPYVLADLLALLRRFTKEG